MQRLQQIMVVISLMLFGPTAEANHVITTMKRAVVSSAKTIARSGFPFPHSVAISQSEALVKSAGQAKPVQTTRFGRSSNNRFHLASEANIPAWQPGENLIVWNPDDTPEHAKLLQESFDQDDDEQRTTTAPQL